MDDFGIKKLSVAYRGRQNTSLTPPSNMARRPKKFSLKTTKSKVIFGIIVFLVLIFGYTGIQAIGIYRQGQKVYAQAKLAADAAKQQNVALAKEELVKTNQDITVLRGKMRSIGFVRFVPLAGLYYSDADHMLSAASHGVNAAIITADSLIPYADVLGLKGDKSFAQGSAEDRIKLAVQTLGKVLPKIDEIEKDLKAAKEDMDHVNPNRYPRIWKLAKVHDQIVAVKTGVNDGVIAVDQGKPLIKLLPELLGDSKEKKYLVIFQNDKELRPTGGFITFYALFRVEDGIIHVNRASNIYDLDDSISYHPPSPEIIRKYLPKVPTFNIRDSNLSPDYLESMKTFQTFLDRSPLAQEDIDGIIALDTHFLVDVLEILGEVQAGGLTFTSKNDPRCDCPQAVYELEDNTSRPVNYVKTNRKALLGDLLLAIMQKALSSSPKLYWGPLIQTAFKDAAEKHIVFYLFNKEAQKGIEALNWGGRIRQASGDYLYINDANFGGAKSNLYVTSSVRMDINTDSAGNITNTTTIDYRNPKPYSDCNLERGGLCLNATLRNFQRVYVPKGSILEKSHGSEVKVQTKEELGKTYFESFFTVNPLGKAQITYVYKLPFKASSNNVLPIMIQKQPGVDKVAYQIYVNGRQVETFDLLTDKELEVKLK